MSCVLNLDVQSRKILSPFIAGGEEAAGTQPAAVDVGSKEKGIGREASDARWQGLLVGLTVEFRVIGLQSKAVSQTERLCCWRCSLYTRAHCVS